MKILLTVIIAIMQAFIVAIPLRGKLSDNRHKFPRNFTKLGWTLIVCSIITMICTIFVFLVTDREEEKSKLTLSNQLSERDSIHQQRIIEAGNKYISKLDSSDKNTIEALAKYSLKYDTAEKRIEKLVRDSTNKNVTIINSEDPNADLCDIKLVKETKDSLTFQLFICSENATAYNIDIKLDLLSKVKSTNQYFSIYKTLSLFRLTLI